MPNDFFGSVPLRLQLQFVLPDDQSVGWAYERLLVCQEAAAIQLNRLEAALTIVGATPEVSEPRSADERKQLLEKGLKEVRPTLYEAHFYFIAWANCLRLIETVIRPKEFLAARKAFKPHRSIFERYRAARDCFEHYDDRLPGAKKGHLLRESRPPGSTQPLTVHYGFVNGTFIHSDQSWDVTSKGLDVLNKAIDDVLSEVRIQVESMGEAMFPATAPIERAASQ